LRKPGPPGDGRQRQHPAKQTDCITGYAGWFQKAGLEQIEDFCPATGGRRFGSKFERWLPFLPGIGFMDGDYRNGDFCRRPGPGQLRFQGRKIMIGRINLKAVKPQDPGSWLGGGQSMYFVNITPTSDAAIFNGYLGNACLNAIL
jgi:hypothetical protein